MPAIDETMVGTRLEICCVYELAESEGGGEVLRWCQGEVMFVSDGTNITKPGSVRAKFKKGEAVWLKWDAIPERNEAEYESSQRLLKSKWNPRGKHTKDSWRLCVK